MRGIRKTALVTGATSGIGAAYARALAGRKYDLVITGRRRDQLKALADELSNLHGISVDVAILDLTDMAKLEKFCRSMKGRTIDMVVNNAGFGFQGPFAGAEPGELLSMVDVHDHAAVRIISAVLPGMLDKGQGVIINVASQAALNSVPGFAVYSASKAFLVSFSECLFMELYDTGIVVQALCPGLTHTSFHEKIGIDRSQQVNRGFMRWMEPQDIVAESLAHVDRNMERKHKTVVCIPGRYIRMVVRLSGLVPRSIYYRIAASMVRKYR